jgi:glycosyltransferase involved in cell wall biosynthesis
MQSALTRHHALVLSHVEASQSGVAAAALGHGLPIVATPVGGLREQVGAGGLGVVAQRCDAPALADAIRLLFSDEGMFEDVRRNILASRPARTTTAFMQKIAGLLLSDRVANSKSPGKHA